jgi:hypothetical protein
VRGIYFATHFNNFYASAPIDEVLTYIEDIALWGVNTLTSWFDVHEYAGIDDPAAKAMIARQGQFFAHARALGMKACIISLSNEAYATSPRHLRASSSGGKNGYVRNLAGHYHVETCPSIPEGEQYIYEVRREICQAIQRVGISPTPSGKEALTVQPSATGSYSQQVPMIVYEGLLPPTTKMWPSSVTAAEAPHRPNGISAPVPHVLVLTV